MWLQVGVDCVNGRKLMLAVSLDTLEILPGAEMG